MAEDSLRAQLQALRDGSAGAGDVRLHAIEALLSRAEGKPPALARRLQQRAAEQLRAYRRDNRSSCAAGGASAAAAGNSSAARVSLADLLERLSPPAPQASTLQTALLAQEQALFTAVLDDDTSLQPERDGLRAAQRFSQTRRRYRAEALLAETLATKPANPGPLNPQMLSMRLMASMQQRSPAYFQAVSGYLESLFWLERAVARKTTTRRRPKKSGA